MRRLIRGPRYQTAYRNLKDMNDFDPIPELKQNDWDVVIFMLAKNSMGYASVINDPFFAAHKAVPVSTAGGNKETWYVSDFPISLMGCAQQVSLEGRQI